MASLIRAARYVDPPWSGCNFFIRVRCARPISSALAPGFRTTGRFASMEEALARIDADPPDVALVDIQLPGMTGIEGLSRLRQRQPRLQMLVLTIHDDGKGFAPEQERVRGVQQSCQIAQRIAAAVDSEVDDCPSARLRWCHALDDDQRRSHLAPRVTPGGFSGHQILGIQWTVYTGNQLKAKS